MSTIREKKGLSLIDLLNDYIALDLETTGLDPSYNNIIEIAAVKVSNGKIIDRFETLVKPPYEIDEFITELTGITNDMLIDAPHLSDIMPSFLEFVGSSVIVGHNVNFDINFIYDSLERFDGSNFSNNFIDTMRLSRRLFKDFENHKLTTLVKNFGISNQPTHRALTDCIATYECYEYMKQYITGNGINLESLLASRATSNKPINLSASVCDFDKSHPLYGKSCVFTGTLQISRKEAIQLVSNVGGIATDSINKETNFLVIGNNEYCTTIKNDKSNKQKKAESYILKGYDIQILSESVFFDLLGDLSKKQTAPILPTLGGNINSKSIDKQLQKIKMLNASDFFTQDCYYWEVAEIYANIGMLNEAVENLEKALECCEPEKTCSYLCDIGRIYSRFMMYDMAIEYHIKAAEHSNNIEDKGYYYSCVGIDYEKLERPDLAIKYYEISITFDCPPHPYKRLAILYRKRGDITNELRIITATIEKYGNNATLAKRFEVAQKILHNNGEF